MSSAGSPPDPGGSAVHQLRAVLVVDDLDAAVHYYRDTLGLTETAALAGPDGAQVVILDAGRATLELANPAQARFIARVETGGVPSTPVRLAFEVDDATAVAQALAGTGARVIATPVRTPWNSLNARLEGPAGLQVTLFQELARGGGAELVGAELIGVELADLGGEPGLLARTVELARQHGERGHLPFAAVVVRDGVVIGTGLNTVRADPDPSAHAEVVALRDAARRIGSPDLTAAVVYSSCEPCGLCRSVAAAASATEIVYAAGRQLVPVGIDATPQASARLIEAVTAVLPGIARAGETGLSAWQLAAPFRAFLDPPAAAGSTT